MSTNPFNAQNIDPATIQPFEVQNCMVFIGAPQFSTAGQHAVFGMITGCKSSSPSLERGIEIRRVLTRAPRMQEQLTVFLQSIQRTELSNFNSNESFNTFGIGWFFRDQQGWGLGLYYENCRLLRSYVEMNGSIPVCEDVMIVSFEKETDITTQIQQRVTLASPGDISMPRIK